jgi:tripartite-type tricarboxylate transporter receptor subunit TctC
VHPSVAAKSVQELVALAKANPGRLTYGSGGVGSTPHLSGELFKSLAGIDVLHVPYKGGAPALNDLVGGQLSFMIENVPGTMPFVRGGKLRALAITSAQRSPLDPTLPTMASVVPGYEVIGWNGLVAVAGTPPEIVARLSKASREALATPAAREQAHRAGYQIVGGTPEQLAARLASEIPAVKAHLVAFTRPRRLL